MDSTREERRPSRNGGHPETAARGIFIKKTPLAAVSGWPQFQDGRLSFLSQWDKKYVWHPFTQQAAWGRRDPVIIASGNGVWLKDIHGRRFMDGVSSLWVNVFGHRKKELDNAVRRQLSKLAHATFLGLTHEPAIRLAQRLIEIAPPGLSRVFYSDNGSTAVEVALKMAYQYWQLKGLRSKTRFVSLKQGYHGDTLGAVSVGGIDLFHARFRDLLFKGWQVTPPRRHPEEVAAATDEGSRSVFKARSFANAQDDNMGKILKRHHSRIAAVVMEPLIQGASGMLLMPRGYLAHVAKLCKRYNVLLIVDEVATGFGRTGTIFAVEQEKVRPDFLCVAKSITGGYLPLAATLTTENIYRAYLGRYEEFKAFFHGHTYTANPLACAVALANLDLYKKENLIRRIRARAQELAAGLAPLKTHPHVKEVRQLGLMAGIELAPYPPRARMGLKVCDAALKRGVWLRPLGDVIVLMPPLAISKQELQFLVRVVKQAIQEATA